MSILITPKGWAVEIKPVHIDGKAPTVTDLADSYTAILKSLLEVISTATCNNDSMPPEYPVFELLESMLPGNDNARAMFRDLRNEKNM